MKVIRLQDETPEVYTEQSRDFQLLCRLYDCVINSTKFDVDSIKKISDTSKIRTNLLPLLQTKIGFFSNAKTDDYTLRMLLEAFPSIIKKKGSLKAINEAITVYLKILGLRIPIAITKTEGATQLYNITIPEHTIVIGLNTAFRNTAEVFKDLLSYVMPAGFGYYFYFFSSIEDITNFIYRDPVAVIYISDELNSQIRSSIDYERGSIEDRLVGNVALMGVRGSINLIDFSPLSYSYSDLTITVIDNVYTINGTASATRFIKVGTPVNYNIGDSLYGCPNGGSSTTYELQIDSDGSRAAVNYGADYNYSSPEEYKVSGIGTNNKVYIRIASGYTCNNLQFCPALRPALENDMDELEIYKDGEWEEGSE